MRVKMLVSISGTFNGQDWPAKGGVIDLPDAEATHLLAGGLAEVEGAVVESASIDAAPENADAAATPRKRTSRAKKSD